MKIAIIHLSDFHIQENCRICSAKLNALVSALSVLGNVDHYVIAFSGDLAASGKINEYRTARTIFPRIFSGIRKRGKNVGFIPLLMVPGNHDLTLPNPARDRQFIQEHYDNGTIEDILPTELKYLDNFYTYSDYKGQGIVDRVFAHKVYVFGTYKIQFNLVNSAPFSTLVPDDKELLYFANKNYFAYFIAKHLILSAQNDPPSTDGIQYALKNICFGINSDIILFVSYLLNNTQVIMSILNEADSLLSPWPEVSLDNKNISLLAVASASKEITPPTADEQQEYSEQKETLEERHYSGDEVEARGLFDYDDSEIDKYPYRLIRAIRYTEMICRALPAFHSRLKVSQKSEIIDFIYSYPRKIIYALLRPIDTHIDELCDMLLAYAAETGKKKSNGSDYTHDDFQNMFFDYARAASLSLYNHFAEICTSPKTTQKLVERDSTDAIEKIARLLIIENSGNTDELLKEAEAVIKHSKDMNTRIMAQIVVRKHLLYNKKLSFSKKQQLVDRIFGKSARKTLLSPSRTL